LFRNTRPPGGRREAGPGFYSSRNPENEEILDVLKQIARPVKENGKWLWELIHPGLGQFLEGKRDLRASS